MDTDPDSLPASSESVTEIVNSLKLVLEK